MPRVVGELGRILEVGEAVRVAAGKREAVSGWDKRIEKENKMAGRLRGEGEEKEELQGWRRPER